MKYPFRFVLLLALTAALTAAPTAGLAQPAADKSAPDKKSTPDSTEPATTEKKPKAGPFHGKLVAVDKIAKTITVGKRTFLITSETKIKKAGKPATLEDGVVGEEASGYVKPREDGKLIATTVNFGPKAQQPENTPKKAKEADKEAK